MAFYVHTLLRCGEQNAVSCILILVTAMREEWLNFFLSLHMLITKPLEFFLKQMLSGSSGSNSPMGGALSYGMKFLLTVEIPSQNHSSIVNYVLP